MHFELEPVKLYPQGSFSFVTYMELGKEIVPRIKTEVVQQEFSYPDLSLSRVGKTPQYSYRPRSLFQPPNSLFSEGVNNDYQRYAFASGVNKN